MDTIQTTVFGKLLSNFTCELLVMRGETSWGQSWRSTLILCLFNPVATTQAKVLVRSLSNFTCKLLMMSGGTQLIWDYRVKCQGQLWPAARGCHTLHCLVTSIHAVVEYLSCRYLYLLGTNYMYVLNITLPQFSLSSHFSWLTILTLFLTISCKGMGLYLT